MEVATLQAVWLHMTLGYEGFVSIKQSVVLLLYQTITWDMQLVLY